MASPQSSDKLGSNLKVTMYDHDPSTTAAVDVGWVDMRDFENFMVVAMFSTKTGDGVTAFTILANADSAGGGADVEIKTHAVGSPPDAVGDYLVLECTAEEIAQEAADAGIANVRYVSANLTMGNNSSDENVVTYILGGAKRAADGLTADYVS